MTRLPKWLVISLILLLVASPGAVYGWTSFHSMESAESANRSTPYTSQKPLTGSTSANLAASLESLGLGQNILYLDKQEGQDVLTVTTPISKNSKDHQIKVETNDNGGSDYLDVGTWTGDPMQSPLRLSELGNADLWLSLAASADSESDNSSNNNGSNSGDNSSASTPTPSSTNNENTTSQSLRLFLEVLQNNTVLTTTETNCVTLVADPTSPITVALISPPSPVLFQTGDAIGLRISLRDCGNTQQTYFVHLEYASASTPSDLNVFLASEQPAAAPLTASSSSSSTSSTGTLQITRQTTVSTSIIVVGSTPSPTPTPFAVASATPLPSGTPVPTPTPAPPTTVVSCITTVTDPLGHVFNVPCAAGPVQFTPGPGAPLGNYLVQIITVTSDGVTHSDFYTFQVVSTLP